MFKTYDRILDYIQGLGTIINVQNEFIDVKWDHGLIRSYKNEIADIFFLIKE